MTESYTQSNILIDLAPPVVLGEYLLNKAKIAEAKALISAYEEMNEVGKQSHDDLARELEDKVREGEQAREQLLQLKSQSTLQAAPIRKLAIDYPSSTSRIEVPNYDPGSEHSQKDQYQQFQGTSNQQTYNYIPQVTVQRVASGSYQQYNPQQWTQYSQQPITQNSSTSYIPYSFASDQGNHNNHSRPVVPTQEQRRVSSQQEPLHYGNPDFGQGQWRTAQMYSPPTPVYAPGPSSQAAYKSRPSQNTQQSSPTNTYPEATVNQSQATASGAQGPLPRKPSNITTTQSQLATALGPQPNASSSNSVPVAVTSPNPISTNPTANPNGNRTSTLHQNTIHSPYPPISHVPTTLPSIYMNHTKFIRELRKALKDWDVKAPLNSYFDHPSNFFRVYKDLNGAIRILMRGQEGKSQVLPVDEFYEWIRLRNTTKPVAPAVPANSQTGASSTSTSSNAQKAISSTIYKAIPSTAVKANIQASSSATPHRPGYPEPGASSKQASSTMSSSADNQGIARQIATPSAPPQTGSSASQIQSSTPISVPQLPLSSPWVQPLPPSTAQTSSASAPKTPGRQLSTIINGVPRFAEQANKKFLASHILFGLGKRRRETETTASTEPQTKRRAYQATGQVVAGVSPSASFTVGQATSAVQKPNVPTALTEPQAKRHAHRATGQAVAGVSPSASYTVGQATPTVQKPNVPNGASAASSSLQQPPQYNFIPYVIPQETHQTPQTSSASSGGQQQPVNVTFEVSSTSKVAAAVEVQEVSKTPGDQQQLVNVTLEVPSTSKAAAALDVPDVSRTPLRLQDARIVPLATTSIVVQTSTLPSPAPLAVSVPVPSLLESEKIPQPVASTVLKQPQASAPVKLEMELPITGVPTPGTSFQTTQKNQPLFLPSPVSSPGINENDDSISGTQSANMASRSFDVRKFTSSVQRKNHAFVLVPRRPPYLVKYFEFEKQKLLRKRG